MATPTLLGPPELYTPKPTPTPTQTATATATTTTTTPSDPFMDQMVSKFNTISTAPPPNMTLTENLSPTFLTTGNPCLDFFFHVVPDTPPDTLLQRLHLAWAHNPLAALKLVCNLRGVRGTGKSDRHNFYPAALWLHRHHPKTLAANLPALADFGYFKDLPEILYLLLEGSEARKIQKEEWQKRKRGSHKKKNPKTQKKQKVKTESLDQRVNAEKETVKRVDADMEIAHVAREEKRVALAKKLVDRYTNDPDFRFLHDRVSEYFAECLRKDLEFLKSGSVTKISLAAKWCPSVDSSFDRHTLLCEAIAKRVFPREEYKEYEGVEEAHYAYRVRDRLRKEVLVPLRKVLELPEVFIGANRWDLIPYNRVASVAMKFYKEKFLKHDKERFEAYLEEVKSGKSTIAAGALLPHEIIGSLSDGDGGDVAELQWKRMVDDLVEKGKMKNCLAVCDVSGSMEGVPMEVSVALGLLVSELSEEPWKGKVVTFSADPRLHLIEGDGLKAKTEFVRTMEWGMNTDFQKVFDLALEVAVSGNLRPDQMIKRVFVFSDMEFDEASENPWETDYQAITRKFGEKGFGDAVPQIVFWNLRDSKATPVPATQKGVALLSGFSKNLLTLFLDNDGELSPEEAMEAAISGPEYQKLVVLD
ncbi:L728 protein [Spatholobus suberectus]|nr:L728 protein [Spatholobus suberectus]